MTFIVIATDEKYEGELRDEPRDSTSLRREGFAGYSGGRLDCIRPLLPIQKAWKEDDLRPTRFTTPASSWRPNCQSTREIGRGWSG